MKSGPHGEEERQVLAGQVLEISTIVPGIKKAFRKFFKGGSAALKDSDYKEIQSYASKILESQVQSEVLGLVREKEASFEQKFRLMKSFVLNSSERCYLDRIEREANLSTRLDGELRTLQQQVEGAKKEAQLVIQAEEAEQKRALNQMTVQEGRLEKAHQRLNCVIHQNAKYREKIDQLRKEKNVASEIYRSLKAELDSKRESMEHTIAETGTIYANREHAEKAVREKLHLAEEERAKHERELSELQGHIDKEKKFYQFLKDKHNEKNKLEVLEKEIKANNEAIAAKRAQNEALVHSFRESEQKEKLLQEVFEKVKTETGIKEPQELLPLFLHLHEKQIMVTKFVNDLSAEETQLQEKITELREQLKRKSFCDVQPFPFKNEAKAEPFRNLPDEEKKTEFLNHQIELNHRLMEELKSTLIETLQSAGLPPPSELEGPATPEMLVGLFGSLEEQIVRTVTEFSKSLSEKIKVEKKGENDEVAGQISELIRQIEF